MRQTREGMRVAAGWLVAALLFVGPALGAEPEAQQSPQTAPAAKSAEELTREVAALRAEIEALKAARAAADLAEIERRVDLLAAEIEKLKLAEAAPTAVADAAVPGLGPAASKVYRTADGLSIGGYGEMLYQSFDGTRDDGSPSGRDDRLDFLRAVVYFGYKWSDEWLFNSEIEFEHAEAGDGENGEVAVEFAYLERRIRPEVNVRAGLLLLPMGLVNELHEPTVFLGARRPEVERVILPTTWRENGLGLVGEVGPFAYRTYVVNGMKAEGFSAGGLRSGRQGGSEALAEDFAWTGRLDWTATPGLLAGASAYWGKSGQTLEDEAGRIGVGTSLLEGHLQWQPGGFDLRALWVRAELDDVARLNRALGLTGSRSVGERLEGYYLQAGYDLGTLFGGGRQSLTPFARWEAYDTQARVPAGFARDPANDVEVLTIGIDWKPIAPLVFKADWQDFDNGAGTAVDQFNLALGYVF